MTATHSLLLILTIVLIAAAPDRSTASEAEAIPIPSTTSCSDVWLVNTRCLPYPRSRIGVSRQMRFQRYDGTRFVSATQDEFLATLDPHQVTCFLVHGNRMTSAEAQEYGLSFRRRVKRGQCPFRFVIWSWPSERMVGPVRDARSKASRADAESYYLASVLATLPGDASVSLVGYSFGARAITGGLHLLGGGMVRGNRLGIESNRHRSTSRYVDGRRVASQMAAADGRQRISVVPG